MRDRSSGCVYCGEDGPYNSEHVVPASLGAGDKWMLEGLVCKSCNDKFSKLETHVVRGGEIGIARIVNQPQGRDRGKHTREPTLRTELARIQTEDGRDLEIDLHHKLVPEVLPYITLRGDEFHCGGSELPKVQRLLARLEELLSNDVTLIQKRPSPGRPHTAILMTWGFSGYVATHSQFVMRSPPDVFWLEIFAGRSGSASILERHKTSIAVQVQNGDAAHAAKLLTVLRKNIETLKVGLAGVTRWTSIEQPQIHVRMEGVLDEDVSRLLAKIGFNLVAHVYGESSARSSIFNAACSAVLENSPLRAALMKDAYPFESVLRPVFKGKHWLMLQPCPTPTGGRALVFISCLYDGHIRAIELAENLPATFSDDSVVVSVDYLARVVKQWSLQDVLAMARETGISAMPQQG